MGNFVVFDRLMHTYRVITAIIYTFPMALPVGTIKSNKGHKCNGSIY